MSIPGVIEEKRKLRLLCLHGYRTSGQILKVQLRKWPRSVLDQLDLVFPDAPFTSTGKSQVEGFFDPPYYEWFQSSNKDFTEYVDFDKPVEYIQECIIKHGPFDGLLGFSQGSMVAAALAGLQAKGLALTKVPELKFLIIISGARLLNEAWAEKAFANRICCPSLHFLGEMDFLKPHGTVLLESFVDPVVIHHGEGHTIPRLDEMGLELMLSFLEKIQNEFFFFPGDLDYLKSRGTELLESFVDPVVIYHREGHTVPSLDEKGLELMQSFLEKMQNEVNNQEKQQQSFRRSSL
ncbi:FSH1 domain-containing protein [Heracleum sosnowskyi]|uniref:FSH1 domain-containing protein n=1 Tax=Heracleum sosnowskyi TaxID=360622 RepID=A0AAD8JJD7_9APIA|nr:FSH1 domain-containing protein [Heracleum sosnowskyi]